MKTKPSLPKVKRYGRRLHHRAQQIWQILTAVVMLSKRDPDRPTRISYGRLAVLMGFDPRAGHTLGRPLGIVGEFCKANNLPTINSIVVYQGSRRPGDGVVVRQGRSPREEQAAAMRVDWFQLRPPTTGTFRRVMEARGARTAAA